MLKRLFTCLAVIFTLTLPSSAWALSCAAPIFDKSSIENAKVIFQGRLISKENVNKSPLKALAEKLGFKGGDVNNMKIFTLSVEKAWKGTKKGDEIKILRNTYWGDGVPVDTDVLVVASEAVGDAYNAPLCSNVIMYSAHAQKELKLITGYFQ